MGYSINFPVVEAVRFVSYSQSRVKFIFLSLDVQNCGSISHSGKPLGYLI